MAERALTDRFYENAKRKLKKRLPLKRYEHAKSVSKTAVQLAKIYGVDERKARLAGLLHDWDKDYSDAGIRKRAKELGIKVDPVVYETTPRLLHGNTAAAALKIEFPEISDDVLQAIARHTSGEVAMSDLDMVIYIADVIEPLRPYKAMDVLRDQVGKVSLEELFLATFRHVFLHLIDRQYRVHPDTVRVWNYYIDRKRKAASKKGTT